MTYLSEWLKFKKKTLIPIAGEGRSLTNWIVNLCVARKLHGTTIIGNKVYQCVIKLTIQLP